MTPPAPAWAGRLSAGAPADLVRRCLTLAAGSVTPDQLRTVLARALEAGQDPDALAVVRALERVVGLPLGSVADEAERLLAVGARMHVVGYPPYPSRLRSAWPELGAPLWLFVRSPSGTLPAGPAVAVVGTRQPSLDGLRTARALGRLLAERGVTVVSGMARGIDQAAHAGALDAAGPTVGVLGAGLDVDYPAGETRRRDEVAAAGGLVSEYVTGTAPRPRNFLWRNRIIAGLADATVVVEGGPRSGALHTARLAGAQGREVLALPGSVNQPTARGPLDLIRDGALTVTRLEDVPAVVGRGPDAPGHGRGSGPTPPPPLTDGAEGPTAAVLALLGPTPVSPGALVAAAGLPISEVMAAVGELVARGAAHRTPRGIARGAAR